MVTETQSSACIHQWWGLSVHWSNIYVKRLAEMLLVTVEVSSCISSALEQWFFQPRAHIKGLKIKAISFGFSQCHRKPAWNPNLVSYLYIHLLVRLPFHLSLARANATKRHLCKCGAGKHNCKKTVISPGTVPSASTWQRFAATSLFLLLKGEFVAEARTWMSFVTWMFCPLAVELCGSLIVLWCSCWCVFSD